MSLVEMKKELRDKYEKLLRCDETRRKTMLRYYEPIESWNPENPEETGLDRIINRIRILAEYGKDPEAENLLRKLGYALVMMPPRDFWTYLYDWSQEAIELLKARKVKVPTAPMVPTAVYAWARRVR